jgi:YbbR domain-containing protein
VDVATVEVRLDGTTVNIDGRYRPVLMDQQGQVLIDPQGQPVGAEGGPVRVSPERVRVQIPVTQQLSYKTVGLQPVLTGTPQSGHLIDGITVEPPAVTIVGSPQALAAVNFATTERVDTTDATSTFARQVSVIVPEGVSVVQEGLARVTVRLSALDLAQAIVTVPLPEGLRPGLELVSTIPSVQVTIRGAPLALRSLQGTDVRASLSLDSLGAGSHQVEVAVSTPPGVTVLSINPPMVQVTIAPITIAPTVTPAEVSSTPSTQGADLGAALR